MGREEAEGIIMYYCVDFIYGGSNHSQSCDFSLELTQETDSLIIEEFANLMIDIHLKTYNLKQNGLKAHDIIIKKGENKDTIYSAKVI